MFAVTVILARAAFIALVIIWLTDFVGNGPARISASTTKLGVYRLPWRGGSAWIQLGGFSAVNLVKRVTRGIARRVREARETSRYRAILANGSEVAHQKRLQDGGSRQTTILALKFRDGPAFDIRDGASAAHTFYEIFLEHHYPKRLLEGAKTVMDVGANIGLFSYYARLHAPSAAIYAFEADPNTFETLSRNVSEIGIDCLHRAVASTPGELTFYSTETSGWSSQFQVLGAANGTPVKVPTVQLSAFIASNDIHAIDFLKVDVEGAEYDILLNDPKLWNTPIKSLVVEADRTPRDGRFRFADLNTFLKDKFRSVREVIPGSNYPLLVCTAAKRAA